MIKKLPVGQQDFEKLILKDSLYVDKTAYIHQLMISGGDTFFLSRPRRFGKSLLLSTIKAIYEGKKALFKGLYIEDKIDWEPYPIVMLDMSKDAGTVETLKIALASSLKSIAADFDVKIDYYMESPATMLEQLIKVLSNKTGKQVVVLIDEHDKPILDAIDNLENANEMRNALSSIYGTLKASSAYLKFLMVTGITKISQTSIFSGFNNLKDLSFSSRYAGICGYTQQELEENFENYIPQLAEKKKLTKRETLAEIKRWYNGYSWDGQTFVYNPFSVLLLFDELLFKPHWYSTGTPTFLLKLLKADDNLEIVLQDSIGVFDTFTEGQALESLDSVALLFQSGYLTIKKYEEEERSFELQIPNEEVRLAISELILSDLNKDSNAKLHVLSKNIRLGFAKGDTEKAIHNLEALLANTTYNTHESNQNESHYQALFQLAMTLSNIDHRGESLHWEGRTDAVLLFEKHVYVVEIKYAAGKKDPTLALAVAMKQIKDKHYYKPFLHQGKAVHLLALVFTQGKIAFQEEIL